MSKTINLLTPFVLILIFSEANFALFCLFVLAHSLMTFAFFPLFSILFFSSILLFHFKPIRNAIDKKKILNWVNQHGASDFIFLGNDLFPTSSYWTMKWMWLKHLRMCMCAKLFLYVMVIGVVCSSRHANVCICALQTLLRFAPNFKMP